MIMPRQRGIWHVVPPIAPGEPAPSPDRAMPDNVPVIDADLPINFEARRVQRISLDEKVENLIFLIESQIDVLVPEVRAAGRLPELYRRVRNLVDRLEAQAVVDANLDESENGAESAASAMPVQEQMPPLPEGRA
jgi:hypothetical protein